MSETSAKKFSVLQKKIGKAYLLSSVIQAEPELDEAIRTFEDRIDSFVAAEEPIRLDTWFTYFAFDNVGQFTFSKPFGFLSSGKDIRNSIAIARFLVPYMTIMAYFHTYHYVVMANRVMQWLGLFLMKHIMDITIQSVVEREKSEKVQHDMMEYWKTQMASENLSRKDLLATASMNVAAGGDTVGTEMQAFVYMMLRRPRCLQLLHQELDTALAEGKISSPIQYNAAQDLPYFQACVSTPMRLP